MPTPAERAGVLSGFASAIISLYQADLISRPSAREELQAMGRSLGLFASLQEDKTARCHKRQGAFLYVWTAFCSGS